MLCVLEIDAAASLNKWLHHVQTFVADIRHVGSHGACTREFREPVDSLYFVAFGLVVVGLVVREASPFPHPFQGKNTSRLIKWTSLWIRWWRGWLAYLNCMRYNNPVTSVSV